MITEIIQTAWNNASQGIDIVVLGTVIMGAAYWLKKAVVREIHLDITGIKADMANVKADMANVKTDMANVKTNLANVKDEMREDRKDVRNFMRETRERMEQHGARLDAMILYLMNQKKTDP